MIAMPYKIGIAALLLSMTFTGGFLYGRSSGRASALKNVIVAFQTRQIINYETNNLDDVSLCLALGGLRDECTDLMRGLDKAAESQ